MSLEQITQLISNYAFPIVCCIALFWKMNKDQEAYQKAYNGFIEAINNNTQALKELMAEVRGKK